MTEIQAKKKFGQNFLKDSTVLEQIIQAMPKTTHKLVEIGPGLGDLTHHLVKIRSVVAFEVDTDLCKHLATAFENEISSNELTIHCGDVLERWNGAGNCLVDAPYDLVANLPYYIATNIILNALDDPQCQNMLVMVQKEVADKFSAQAGEKAFSALAVLTQTVGRARTVITVPPQAFNPPPKVDSAVVLIEKNGKAPVEGLSKFLKIAFAQPRKTLAKNLSTHFPKEEVAKALESLDLTPTVRPHQTTTFQYHQLFNILKGMFDGREKRPKRSKS